MGAKGTWKGFLSPLLIQEIVFQTRKTSQQPSLVSVLPKASITPKETQCPFRLLKHKEKVSLTSLKVATLPKSMTERAEMDVKFAGEGI